MLDERSESIARDYWAAHLGCAPEELFAEPVRVLTHGGELTDYVGAFALFRRDAVVVSFPPDRADELRALWFAESQGCSPSGFAAAFSSVSAVVIGPAYIGYAAAVASPGLPARALNHDDEVALHSLEQACDPIEWEHGGSSIEHRASGVFIDGQLVAMAGYEVWGGTIAHISIVTHPSFRGRGCGRSAVAHLAQRAMRIGLLPQYRTLASNRASIRIAESLGFRPYATSMAVRLKPNDG